MKQVAKTLAVALVLFGAGCYVERRYAYDEPYGYPRYSTYAYWYYPDVEVYYYPYRHVYYWRDGGHWRSSRYLPRTYTLRSHVDVRIESDEPWRRHDEIVRRYPRDWRSDR